jgi:hypothetical protein
MEFISSSSTPWCCGLLDSNVGSIIFPKFGEFFPNVGDSSPTPVSPFVSNVPPCPKVSTPLRSPRRSLSVLPFPCVFGGHPHLIPVFLFFSVLFRSTSKALPELSAHPCVWPTLGLGSAHPRASPARRPSRLPFTRCPQRITRQEPEPHVTATISLSPTGIQPSLLVSNTGEHLPTIPSFSSLHSVLQLSP